MITIAMAQLKSSYLNKEKNISAVINVLKKCKKKAVDLVVFPELFITGYEIKDNINILAEPIDGPSIKKLRKAALEFCINIIIGFPERSDNQFYNTAILIKKNGEIGGRYRKVHLFKWEKDIFSHGTDASLLDLDGTKLSMMMTFDAGFPEMARISALKGAEMIIVLAAHVVPYQVYHKNMMSARALENQIFIVVVNKVGVEHQSVYFGESAIITPYGDYLNKVEHSEKIIIESIDISLVYKVRNQLPMQYLNNRSIDFYYNNGLCSKPQNSYD